MKLENMKLPSAQNTNRNLKSKRLNLSLPSHGYVMLCKLIVKI
jgi:hypothetical protein